MWKIASFGMRNANETESPRRRSRPPRGHERRRAFSLVEIMVVVIIIGVLAAVIVPGIFGRTGKARQAVAKQKLATIESAINLFHQDYGRFPEVLDDLVSRPSDVAAEQWTPPSLKRKDLLDPWGNPFQYRYPGDHWTFDLYSLGADGQTGGDGEDEDVVNW